jgi:hypothetical protein
MWLLLVLANLFADFIGEGTAHPLWIQLVGSAFLGFYFVVGGAKTAPSRRATTAIVLAAVLDSGIVAVYILMRLRGISTDGSLWWSILSSIITVGGTVLACAKLYSDSYSEGEHIPGLRQILATLVVSVVVTSSMFLALIKRLPIGPPAQATGDESSPREKVRERLAVVVEETNREIAKKPFSLADCPPPGSADACLELTRVDLRNDLGIDRHYRVHYSRANLDKDPAARKAWARLVGQDEFSFGFYEDREQFCRGETLQLMRDYGLRIGIVHYTVGGIEITRGVIDLAACLDLQEKAETPGANDEN